jgi:hypothetical protein
MALESIEKLKAATYENPKLYVSNLQDSVIALSSLALLPQKKEKLIKGAKEELAYAAALGTMKQSPQSLLNTNSNLAWKEDLPFEQRLKLEHQAEGLLQHRQIMVQHQVQSLSHAHFASLVETGQGIKGFDDLLRSSFAPNDSRLLNLQKKEVLYKHAFLVSQQLKSAPFNKGQKIITQLAPKAGDLDYDQKEKLYHILIKQFESQVKQAKDDPAKLNYI